MYIVREDEKISDGTVKSWQCADFLNRYGDFKGIFGKNSKKLRKNRENFVLFEPAGSPKKYEYI